MGFPILIRWHIHIESGTWTKWPCVLGICHWFGCERYHQEHDDVIKWKHFPRYWTFVRGIHWSPVKPPPPPPPQHTHTKKRPVTVRFGVLFHLHLNIQLSKQSWGWWFETPSCPLWRHCDESYAINTCSGLVHGTSGSKQINMVNQKDQWRGALMFHIICAWTNNWANNREADDLRCHRAHYDANVVPFRDISLARINHTLSPVLTTKPCRIPQMQLMNINSQQNTCIFYGIFYDAASLH